MGAYFQRIQLMGNVGAEPRTTYTQRGVPICTFTLFVREHWKNEQTGERRHKETPFRCQAFSAIADQASKIVAPGTFLFIEGRMRHNEKDGVHYWDVNVDRFQLIDRDDVQKVVQMKKRREAAQDGEDD